MAGIIIRYRQGGVENAKVYEWTPEKREMERAMLKIMSRPGFEEFISCEDLDDARARGEVFAT